MNDPGLVGGLQRFGDLLGDREGFIDGDGASRDAIRQRRTLDELEDQRSNVLGLLQPVDGADVRMVQAGQDLRLPLESGEAIRVVRKGLRQDLQSDLAVELGVGGQPDLPHAAFPE